jgi:hypothetical protein
MTTHGMFMSGRLWAGLSRSDSDNRAEVCHLISILNGNQRCSLLLFRVPPDSTFADMNLDSVSSYIQCAGSADRLTVEVRRQDGDAKEHYVVGRSTQAIESPLTTVVRWGTHEVIIHPHEVFDADEACLLFSAYYETNWVPGGYSLRPIDP